MVGALSQLLSSVNGSRARRRMVDHLNHRLGGGSVDDYFVRHTVNVLRCTP